LFLPSQASSLALHRPLSFIEHDHEVRHATTDDQLFHVNVIALYRPICSSSSLNRLPLPSLSTLNLCQILKTPATVTFTPPHRKLWSSFLSNTTTAHRPALDRENYAAKQKGPQSTGETSYQVSC
jgi:hypothetical protein